MDYRQAAIAADAHADAVRRVGGQSAFERETGVKQQTTSYRLKRRLPLQGEYVFAAERASGISRHLLRPDLYPAEPSTPLSDPALVGAGGAITHCDRAIPLKRGDA